MNIFVTRTLNSIKVKGGLFNVYSIQKFCTESANCSRKLLLVTVEWPFGNVGLQAPLRPIILPAKCSRDQGYSRSFFPLLQHLCQPQMSTDIVSPIIEKTIHSFRNFKFLSGLQTLTNDNGIKCMVMAVPGRNNKALVPLTTKIFYTNHRTLCLATEYYESLQSPREAFINHVANTNGQHRI